MKHSLLFLLLLFSVSSFAQDLENDRLALIKLYEGLDGKNWELQNPNSPEYWIVPGKPGDNPCGWRGIGCDIVGGVKRVAYIQLESLGGRIAPEIGKLDALKMLRLEGGEGLFVEHPPLSGKIPEEILNLKSLEDLYLMNCIIDRESINTVFDIVSLKWLTLTPLFPLPDQFDKLVNLEGLSLYGYVGNDAKSENLGNIPVSVFSLSKLKVLDIYNAGFSGPIRPEIGNLKNLVQLGINGLIDAGPIPIEIGNLTNLERLMLQNGHTGQIPAEFNNLGKVISFTLNNNSLGGAIPALTALSPGTISVSGSNFNFDQLEPNAFWFREYNSQRLGPITIKGDILSIYAGGTLSNNTYKWFRDGREVARIVGDSTYKMTVPGVYGVIINNAVARNGVLISEDFNPPLPVTLVSFSAKSLPNQNTLTWKTTSETNNKGFEIEKSIDARSFETIGFVEGNGDSKDLNNYHFTDPNPFNITYYRLKQLDYDGKFEHSKIIVARNTPEWKVYPNPAQNHLTIAGLRSKENVSIFNQRGVLVSKQITDSNGSVDLRNLANGIYNLQIGGEAKKLLIQK